MRWGSLSLWSLRRFLQVRAILRNRSRLCCFRKLRALSVDFGAIITTTTNPNRDKSLNWNNKNVGLQYTTKQSSPPPRRRRKPDQEEERVTSGYDELFSKTHKNIYVARLKLIAKSQTRMRNRGKIWILFLWFVPTLTESVLLFSGSTFLVWCEPEQALTCGKMGICHGSKFFLCCCKGPFQFVKLLKKHITKTISNGGFRLRL